MQEDIDIIWHGEAVALEYPIPPGIVGHDPAYKSSIQYDLPAANALLDKFGYKKDSDGWRTLPDGKPLVIHYTARNDSNGQQQSEIWKKTYDSIHIRMEGDSKPFPDILKAEKQCKLQMRTNPWIADFPDGDNFMQLYYSKNIHQTNNGCYTSPEFDKLYEQTQKAARRPRARSAVPQDDAYPRNRYTAAPGLCPLPQHAGTAESNRFQEASNSESGVAVHRYRQEQISRGFTRYAVV
ncbi:ABC transporter substrate-binding protein [Undibacterium arcticum]